MYWWIQPNYFSLFNVFTWKLIKRLLTDSCCMFTCMWSWCAGVSVGINSLEDITTLLNRLQVNQFSHLCDFKIVTRRRWIPAADVTVTHDRGAVLQCALLRLFAGGGDCFCSERSAGADLSTEPKLSRVIVSFLLNRIRAQRCGGFSPPVNRAAGSRQRLPAGQPLKLAGVTELLRGLEVYVRERLQVVTVWLQSR